MSDKTGPLHFNATEEQLISRAANTALTKRRIFYSTIAPLAFITLLLAMYWHTAQPPLLLWLFVAYVTIGMFEKMAYGRAVLLYKGVIQKLLARVTELERQRANFLPTQISN